jgi:hypothetical protein
MRTNVALLVGAVLLGGLALAGTATAADGQYHSLNDSLADDDNGTDVGVCVIGVDSPCNGEGWDGDNETEDEQPRDDERIGDDGESEDDEAGICLVGADSPCNDGNGTTEDGGGGVTPVDENESSDHTEPNEDNGESADDEAGICLVGADSACNGADGSSADARITLQSAGQESQSIFESLFGVLAALF